MDCQIKRHCAGESSKGGHSPIVEAKDFIRHNKSDKETGKAMESFVAEDTKTIISAFL